MLNKWIKESVVSHVTEEYLKKFIRRINFTQRVKCQLETVQYVNRQPETEHLKQIQGVTFPGIIPVLGPF